MNINNKYYNITITGNQFHVEESLSKPKKQGSTKELLSKIDRVLTENLHFSPENSEVFPGLSREEVLKLVEEKVCSQYESKLSTSSRLIIWVSKKFGKARQVVAIHKKLDQNFSELERAKKLGYEGDNLQEGNQYVKELFAEIHLFCQNPSLTKEVGSFEEDKLSPPNISAYHPPTIFDKIFKKQKVKVMDFEKVLSNIDHLTMEEILDTLSTPEFHPNSFPKIRKLLIMKMEEEKTENTLNKKDNGDNRSTEYAKKCFEYALQYGEVDLLKFLLKQDFVENPRSIHIQAIKTIILSKSLKEETAIEIIEHVLDHMNLDKSNAYTPIFLQWAVIEGREKIVEFLLTKTNHVEDKEALLGIAMSARKKPLKTQHLHILHTVLEGGVDPNSYLWGNTPLLQCLVANGEEKAVNLLLQYNVDVDHLSTNGKYAGTPLWTACRLGHENIVRMLLEKGASLTLGYNGMTPLEIARKGDFPAIVTVLQQHSREKKSSLS